MGKLKIVLISFLIFGLFIQSFGQSSIEYEKFFNKVQKIRPRKYIQKFSFSTQKLKQPDHKIFKKNPLYHYPLLKNLFFQYSLPLNSIHYEAFPKNFSSEQIPMFPLLSTGIIYDWSLIYESKSLPSWDSATDLIVDNESNVYVTGYSTNMQQGMDFHTIKYDTNGNQLWSAYYNGDINGDDVAKKIAVDNQGHIYVGGNSSGSGSGVDVVVVKYNNQGQQLWEARYDGIDHEDDLLMDMALDDSGNLYFTSGSDRSFATIKIDAEGVQQWHVEYQGTGNYDWPMAIALDRENNVYVTGWSKISEASYFGNCTVLKYNSNGEQIWQASFITTDSVDVVPKDLVVDVHSAVYVTGMRYFNGQYDFITIKFNATGQQVWADIYDGRDDFLDDDFAETINLDDKGNIYVTGSGSDLSRHYNLNLVTIKYSPDGIRQWVARYKKGFNTSSHAIDAGVDSSGNLYVLGYGDSEYEGNDYLVIKYNSNGSQLWEARYHSLSQSWTRPHAMAINKSGGVFFTGERESLRTGLDYITVKFDTNGIQQWAQDFNGIYREDGEAVAVQVDESGDVIAFGGSGNKFVTTKYSSQGTFKWAASFAGREYYSGTNKSLAVDGMGNIFVIVPDRPDTSRWDYDFVTVKYKPNGVQQWIARYDRDDWQQGEKQNYPVAVVVDQAGNAYVTGRSLGQSGSYDIVTIKYNPGGVEQWVNRFRSSENDYAYVTDLAIDRAGNIIVAGMVTTDESNILIIKYDSKGRLQWETITPNETSYFIDAKIKVDDWNNIYVLSNRDKSCMLCAMADFDNGVILKYDSHGNKQWIAECQESEGIFYGGDMGIDLLGNIYVCGTTWGSDLRNQFVIKKYNADGIELWTALQENSGNWSFPRCLALDRENNIYVTGDVGIPGSGTDALVVKYDASGEEKWAVSYGDPRNTSDITSDMKVDRQGNIYLAGSANGKYWSNFKIVKFSQTGTDTLTPEKISGYKLQANIPNPFRKQTVIYYTLPQASKVQIEVFNQLGQQVAVEDLGRKPAGRFAYYFIVDNLPSGIYFYRLKAGDYVKTRKMVVVQ